MWNHSGKRRLWCHGPLPAYALDEDWADRWYIGARTLALVRPGQDLIVLPGGSSPLLEFAQFCCCELGIGEEQILWTSGSSYVMDNDIRSELLGRLSDLTAGNSTMVVPYSVTAPFQKWAGELGLSVIGDEANWVSTYGSKAILHPRPCVNHQVGSLLTDLLPDLCVARGYTCTSSDELIAAWDLLQGQGIQEAMIKPVMGATGEGILPVTSVEELRAYEFPMGTVLLEERLFVDQDEHGGLVAPSIQYVGTTLLGPPTDQMFHGMVAHEGNALPSRASTELQAKVVEVAQRIIDRIQPQGPGGFDFLSVGGEPVLVDPNVGRFTGGHPARIFLQSHAPEARSFMSWKVSPDRLLVSVADFWQRLQQRGIALSPSHPECGGVFPLCYLQGMYGMFLAVGVDRDELDSLRHQVEECLV